MDVSSCDVIAGEGVGLDGVWRQWTLLTSYCVAYKIHKIVLQKHWSQSLMPQSMDEPTDLRVCCVWRDTSSLWHVDNLIRF